jgi:hypothetical protein
MWANDECSTLQRALISCCVSTILVELRIDSSIHRGSVRIVGAGEVSVAVAHFTGCVEGPLVITNEVQKAEVW